jgi:hypothetical protein
VPTVSINPVGGLTLSTTPIGGAATDFENSKNSSFMATLHGRVDPTFPLSSNASLNLRGGLAYSLEIDNSTTATTESFGYTGFNDGTSVAATFSYSETSVQPTTWVMNDLAFEIGGTVALQNTANTIEVETGMFINPQLTFWSYSPGDEVTTSTATYSETGLGDITDTTGTIGPGQANGTLTTVETTVYTGSYNLNFINTDFLFPVSTRISLFGGAMQIINGYILSLNLSSSSEIDKLNGETTTVDSGGGTTTETPPAASVDSTVTEGKFQDQSASASGWSGRMNFMLRFLPMDGLTVDLFGNFLMDALDFDLFSPGTAGESFNISEIIDQLGIGVTFNLK